MTDTKGLASSAYYTLEDARQLLGLNRSDLNSVIENKKLVPVLFTASRQFLSIKHRGQNDWQGLAVFSYRGHVQVAHSTIVRLLDNHSVNIGAALIKILDVAGVGNISSQNPYVSSLPLSPLIEWSGSESVEVGGVLSNLAAPMPKEIKDTIQKSLSPLALLADTDSPSAELAKQLWSNSQKLDNEIIKPKLNFTENSHFHIDDLRIPLAAIESFKRHAEKQEAEAVSNIEQAKAIPRVRENQLHNLVISILNDNPAIKLRDVWRIIREDCYRDEPLYDVDNILLEVDGKCIEWVSKNDYQQSCTYKTMGNLVSKFSKSLG